MDDEDIEQLEFDIRAEKFIEDVKAMSKKHEQKFSTRFS
jgi:hypothetical protein